MSILDFFTNKKKISENDFNLLVIDDNLDLIEQLKLVKIPIKINIIYATTSREAAKLLKSMEIHAVLADVQMDDMYLLDYELNKIYDKIPIFRMSGEYSSYSNLILMKPFTLNEYKDVIIQLYGLGKSVFNKKAS